MNRVKFTLLTAGLVLAMAFTFSCSSDDDGGGGGGNENGGGGGDKGNDIGNYRTVVIGTQTWMAENLNYAVAGSKCYGEGGEVMIGYDYDEDEIMPTSTSTSTTTLSATEVQANCDKYGRLYDWATAMALPPSCNENSCFDQIQELHQGICPSGWHIPSIYDYRILMEYVDYSGAKLKATSGWEENGNGTDEFGFSALPSGWGIPGGYFSTPSEVFAFVGVRGSWWSATTMDEDDRFTLNALFLYIRIMPMDDPRAYDMDDAGSYKSFLSSVRCLKDYGGGGGGDNGGGGDGGELGDKGNDIGNYRTAVIGTQTWMAENLNYAVEGSKCCDKDPANCDKYGRLYDWATAMALPSSCNSNSCSSQIQSPHQGICPSGWHIPSDDDWDILIDYADYVEAGAKLKATSGWNNNGNGTDEYGFSALPGGLGYSGGIFGGVGSSGYWWSASERDSYSAYIRFMQYSLDYVLSGNNYPKSYLFSVRCLQD